MTNFSPRDIPGFRHLRENPDLWAIGLLAVTLLAAQSPAADMLRATVSRELLPRNHATAPWAGMESGPATGDRPTFHFSQVVDRTTLLADRDDADILDLSIEEWAARLDQKRARLWNRLELKMRQLEQRIEKQQGRAKFRSIATRSE